MASDTSSPEASAPLTSVTVAENVDLLSLILVRLEAKPLMRFKSVSKQWLSLISSTRFSHLHTLQNLNPKPSVLFFPPRPTRDEIAYEFVLLDDPSATPPSPPFRYLRLGPDPSIMIVSSSSNGLLLCSPWKKQSNCKAYIFNPTTKQFSVLTPPEDRGGLMSAASTRYSLAFDPLRSPHYKVVMARSASETNTIGGGTMISEGPSGTKVISTKEMFEIHIYSSETRLWKKHEHEVEWRSFFDYGQGVYLNGAMHWANRQEGLMCFDVDRECTRPMPEPPGYRGWEVSAIRHMGESGGELHIVDIQGYEIMEMDVYVLERDYSKWSQKYRVDTNGFSAEYPRMIRSDCHPLIMGFYDFSLLRLVQVGDDEHLVIHVEGKVISYSFKSKRIKELHHHPMLGKVCRRSVCCIRPFDGHLYSETLACA